MGLTVITSTFNCVYDIQNNLENISQLKQSLAIQWIVIDGCSMDGTKELLEGGEGEEVDVLISEIDDGIYDAWNKAIKYISHDWVIFMGAGDIILESGIKSALDYLSVLSADDFLMLYCNVRVIDGKGETVAVFKDIKQTDFSSGRPALPCHQGVLCSKVLFDEVGGFDTTYKIAGDSKFLFTAKKYVDFLYLDVFVCNMLNGGVSTSSKSAIATMKEIHRLNKELKLQVPFVSRMSFLMRMRFKSIVYSFFGEFGVDFVRKFFLNKR